MLGKLGKLIFGRLNQLDDEGDDGALGRPKELLGRLIVGVDRPKDGPDAFIDGVDAPIDGPDTPTDVPLGAVGL